MEKDRLLEQLEDTPSGLPSYSKILAEFDTARNHREKRIELLEQLSSPELNGNSKSVGVVAHLSRLGLIADDVGILADVLLGLGDVEILNLILESPGGDGEQVEKFVSLCRNLCKQLRVVIPNDAKSAATLISLGADEIIMGPTSELGPIDAQIESVVNGVRRYLSAQSFIDSRDWVLTEYSKRKNENGDIEPILQMVTTLDLPFIAECERLMDFGRDVGKKLLCEYMLKDAPDKKSKAERIVDELSSVQTHKVHGRRINGPNAKSMGLNVRICGHDDPYWRKASEYYKRAIVAIAASSGFKLFETKHDVFMASAEARN